MLKLVTALLIGQLLDPNYGLVQGWSGDSPVSGNSGLVASDVLFDFNPASRPPSVANLDSTLCINGTCVAPTVDCRGPGASASSWACVTGGAMTAAGSGGTFSAESPLAETAVNAGGTRCYVPADTTLADVTTEDLVVEIVTEWEAAGNTVLNKGVGGIQGYRVYSNASAWCLGAWVSTPASAFACSAGRTDRAWDHALLLADRSGSAQWYVNGAASGGAASLAAITTMTSTTGLSLLTAGGGVGVYTRGVGLIRVWKLDNWLDTHLQATVAAQRFAALNGTKAPIARGSAYPTVATRASTGTLSKCTSNVTSLFLMGANWPRVNRDCSSNALYWSEPSVTNTFLQSRTLATSWTKLDAGDSIGGSVTTPFGLTSVLAGYIGDATDGDHGVTQAATVTAAVWTASVIAKAGSKTWAYMSDDTVANATGYFNLSTCATGTKGAGGRELFATSLGNGWCQIGISFTGTAASHTFAIQAADADSDKTVAGDGATVMGYFTEMQLERYDYPTTRYPTTTASAARSADSLAYASSGNVSAAAGSVVCSVVSPSHISPLVAVLDINDASSNNKLSSYFDTTTGRWRALMRSGASLYADVTGTTDITDGVIHTAAFSWATNDFKIFVDGASEGTPDTSGTVPASLTQIQVGRDQSAGIETAGGIKRCRVFDRTNVRQ